MIIDDIIAVRFLSRPGTVENLRFGSYAIAPWLDEKEISKSKLKSSIAFELPSQFNVLRIITPELIKAVLPFREIFIHEMKKLDFLHPSEIRIHSIPLTAAECILIYDFVDCKFTFMDFVR